MLQLALLALAPAAPQCLETSDQPPIFDRVSCFGSFVSASPDVAVAGTRGDGVNRQAVVYERVGAEWMQTQRLDAGFIGNYFSTCVALSGSTIVVSNIRENLESGKAYVYERPASGGPFALSQELIPLTSRQGSHFGRRIDIDGDRMIVSAPMDATTNYRGGTVYVFERIAGAWTETWRIDSPAPSDFAFFGLGMALDGDRIAIAQLSGLDAGVRIFVNQSGAWSQEQWIPSLENMFGYELDLEGDTLVVGSPENHEVADGERGSAHVYRRIGGVWTETQIITRPAGSNERYFGQTIEFDGTRLAVSGGSPELASNSRSVVIMEDIAGTFVETQIIERPGESSQAFGAAVAFSGDDLWVGDPFDPTGGSPGDLVGALHRISLEPLVIEYCDQASPNSSGEFGRLSGAGCPTRFSNDLTLTATGLPRFSFAVAFISAEANFIPMIVSGIDDFCIGTAARGGITQADVLGTATFGFDVEAVPTPMGSVMAMAGDNWFAQVFHRDAASGIRATSAVELRVQ